MSAPWEKYQPESGPWAKYSMGDKPANPFNSFPELDAAMANSSPILGSSKLGKAWEMLKVPAQMSQRGLEGMTRAHPYHEPTGNKISDVLLGAPKIGMETLSEAAPGFINRASIATGMASKGLGLAGKVLDPVGRGIANVAEDWAGIRPEGALSAAAGDSRLMLGIKPKIDWKNIINAPIKSVFTGGKAGASELYQDAKTGSQLSEKLRSIPTKDAFIKVADKLAVKGQLPPENALEGRKIAGKLLKKGNSKFTDDYLRGLIEKFNKVAKSDENISEADFLHKRALQGSALRSPLPKNVGGRASPFKVAEALALAHLGPLGKVVSLAFSPAALGTGATVGGMAGRAASNPALAVSALQGFRRLGQPNQ